MTGSGVVIFGESTSTGPSIVIIFNFMKFNMSHDKISCIFQKCPRRPSVTGSAMARFICLTPTGTTCPNGVLKTKYMYTNYRLKNNKNLFLMTSRDRLKSNKEATKLNALCSPVNALCIA